MIFIAAVLTGSPAIAATEGEALAKLAAEYWESQLAAEPVEATSLGDRRFDDRLDDNSPEGIAADRARNQRFLDSARQLDDAKLSNADRLTRTMLVTALESSLARLDCGLHEFSVDPMGGPPTGFLNVPAIQTARNATEARAMVARWRAIAPWMDHHVAHLARGKASGKIATTIHVEKVIQQLKELLAQPTGEWSLASPARTPIPGLSDAEAKAFAKDLSAAVELAVKPAFERYLSFLEKEIRPQARSNDKPGLVHLRGGEACYRAMIKVHTSLDLSPDEIHRTGLQEVERIDAAAVEIGKRVFGVADRKEIQKRLRTDAKMHFATRAEVQAKAEEALARAKAAIPRFFGILPKAPCEVVPMEAHEEKHSTIAYYRQPALDGSRPGRYYVNTYAPETRPRYEAEALAFHEAIPGHHLQIAIAQEMTGLAEFRKHTGVTAYVEGWGLYTERLADEMGLYTGDLDRLGMLSFEAWRACRLVVDTGMHAKGWTRKQAIDFMLDHTGLAENNVTNEVDRYIAWPGQALAYKIGQLEILRLREDAKKRLGPKFDLRAFHDVVLGNGAISLPALRAAIETYCRGT